MRRETSRQTSEGERTREEERRERSFATQAEHWGNFCYKLSPDYYIAKCTVCIVIASLELERILMRVRTSYVCLQLHPVSRMLYPYAVRTWWGWRWRWRWSPLKLESKIEPYLFLLAIEYYSIIISQVSSTYYY
jgi:hypothetical protein